MFWSQQPLPEPPAAAADAGAEILLKVHSPDEQQNGCVQNPLQGAEPDALDPDQLVGFVPTQTEQTAARHGPGSCSRCLDSRGFQCGRGICDSLLDSSSCVKGHVSRLLQLLSLPTSSPQLQRQNITSTTV